MECTDWIPESSPANDSEGSGDSDEYTTAVAAAVSAVYDDDDAESCTEGGGGGGGGNGAAGRWETMEEGWVSLRCWFADCAPDYEAGTEIDDAEAWRGANGSVPASTTTAAARRGELAVVDIESDRLFWEACLAHGYA